MANGILVIDEFSMVKMELLGILKDKNVKILGVKDSYEAEKIISYNKSLFNNASNPIHQSDLNAPFINISN